MPFYDHKCFQCEGIFEEFYSAKNDPPTTCSLCGVDGYVQRQIPDVVHGRVPLTGQELKKSITAARNNMHSKVAKNEDLRANIIGETAYEKHLTAQEKIKDTYK